MKSRFLDFFTPKSNDKFVVNVDNIALLQKTSKNDIITLNVTDENGKHKSFEIQGSLSATKEKLFMPDKD